jgi:hypothetical protein
MDNLLLRIPVIAGACLVSELIYYGLHRLFGITPNADPVVTISYTLIGTTIVGTVIYILLERVSAEKRSSRKPEMFKPRRQTRRRNPIRLSK